jgi:DNA-binding NarL/FixJ family response regulator
MKERDSMLKIVVVDDNLQFVSVLENYLQEKSDIQVVGTASDGWSGL